jgi:DNA-binding transcriptional regulator WhiA
MVRGLRRYPPLERKAELAFLIGLTLGDGSLWRSSRTESLRITLGTDKPLLIEYAAEVIRGIFHKEPYIRKRKYAACADVGLYQNDLSRRLGIPLGSRKDLVITVPRWIAKEQEFVTAWLKGLFEAEGSLCIHKPTYTYNFAFSNRNPSLLHHVRECLASLGFHPEGRWNAIRLRRKEEVEKFRKLITFREYGHFG